uniref:CobW C-terminal domain-containing protein n=1 Tax=Aureoumbra lagunensis TaxID=44058 RepID=A0A7S3JV87_9STRA|mmetsp:Transcript_8875/g.12343  ORF Transcript_8875/g.12343 Transcript_8875/m.12343 type:complete len:351 (+) Transcript_8875:41-1093(+)
MSEEKGDKTPFVIVTGFLGAGKTTLVNHILKEQSSKRICVIENEFGEINIDEKLVSENLASKEDLIQMDNGCACCSIRGDLVRTLGNLVAKRKQFDAVLLETTGLADPAPIIATIKSNQWIDDSFEIDSVVCLADAKHIKQHLDEVKPDGAVNEAVQQVAFSDRIILNKTDLVSQEELDAIKAQVMTINHFAVILTSTRSRVDLDQIIGIHSFDVNKCVELDPVLFDEANAEEADRKKPRIHDLSMVSSVGISVEGDLDVPKFNLFMAELLQTRAADLYRTKGVLSFAGQGDTKFVFQGVHEQINFGPAQSPWQPNEPRVSKIVFIGRNLDRKFLNESIRACLVSSDSSS